MNLKRMLRQILPVPVMSALKIRQGQWNLSRVSRRACNVVNLKPHSQIDLAAILASDELAAKWRDQQQQIARFAIPETAGGVNPGDRRAISHLIGGLRPRAVLEVGTHIGASTAHIATAMRDAGMTEHDDAKLVTVDIADVNDPVTQPWLQFGARISPRQMIDELGLAALVEFVAAPSIDFMRNTDRKFDLVFLDGDHAAETVYQEVPLALNVLKPGGVVLLHDYFPNQAPLWPGEVVRPGPALAMARLMAENTGVTVLPFGKLPWLTKRGTNVTSLALVLKTNTT